MFRIIFKSSAAKRQFFTARRPGVYRYVFASGLCAALAVSAGAQEAHRRGQFVLRGERLTARFQVEDGGIKVVEIEDARNRAKLRPGEAFRLQLRDGRVIAASEMKMSATPVEEPLAPIPSAARRAEQIAGRELCADLSSQDPALEVHWCALLRDNTNYLRQEITLHALAQPVDIAQVRLFDLEAQGARVVGKVPGSPIVAGNFFFGFEHPLSESAVEGPRATAILKRVLPLGAGQSITYSSVVGVAAPGQMRREFLAYLEDERAHPYRTFLHYNSWFDLGVGERFDEAQVLDRVHAFGEELVRKRGVTMDSFLLDDGWDNTNSVWGFNSGLPERLHQHSQGGGAIRLRHWRLAFSVGRLWSGKRERIAAGKREGLETVKGGFALSAPRYYAVFQKTCLEMITRYGVNQFKFDGTGNASQVFPGSIFDSDFSAAIHLIEDCGNRSPTSSSI